MSKSRKHRYNSRRARELQGRANLALVLAGGIASAGGAALFGSGGSLYTIHYTFFGICGSLAALALALMRQAMQAELKWGLAGIVFPERQPLRYTGNKPKPVRSVYVAPQLPVVSGTPMQVPAIPAAVYQIGRAHVCTPVTS